MQTISTEKTRVRRDWTLDEVSTLFQLPFADLLFQAHQVHRTSFPANTVQMATLLSVKTGACPEDCAYCPQSIHHDTGLNHERLLPLEEVIQHAREARDRGATRFCMGAAWRSPRDAQVETVSEMVAAVKDLGMETCVTLGMLSQPQAQRLKAAGLDYYNHNLDTSASFYPEIISTRTYQDRLDTLDAVRAEDIKVCCERYRGYG